MASTGNNTLINDNIGIFKRDAFIVLVKTEWNAAIVDELENGCMNILREHQARVEVLTVPGCVEIPFAINRHWRKASKMMDEPHAYIALGCVIQGDTPHFDYVCRMVADGILHLNMTLPVPTIFGVLTVNTNEQALERIGGKHGHKGEEAAITAYKMID
ncbi:MAG TPA: 6,7-dimethyl-8-ribityllumazine synthase [Niabella sp.]|nr:6,7-dimethyl-8-ribityllumazine synthase [Niabella sp.]HQW16437.1 6,7-dimethyl-8-ribityllumazine synthase [Niabella sp.]HQX20857.1 6,7-dimethyl-8-ribityllumazine synthase [Niabella sp.]HQX41575.1 6,7-dimethyl-8-ribityllumazine synthase [Niabella sp.]HRB08508.1 6,7-dimethyl-8-ribityllumazine synthase [Niabella sp.]